MKHIVSKRILNAYKELAEALTYKLHRKPSKGRIFFYHKIKALKTEIARQMQTQSQHRSLYNVENLMRQLL